MKPLILITGAHKTNDGLQEHQLFRHYTEALAAAGGLPLLALEAEQEDAARLVDLADGLLLTGGVDVDPRHYGEAPMPACGAPDPARDRLELLLIRAFAQAGRPIFGICRGLQILNVALGGSLIQDIPGQLKKNHTYNSIHPATAVPGSLIHRLFGNTFTLNSLHHQSLKKLGRGLRATVHSEDGLIVEAAEHTTLPMFGVQWHPERMVGSCRWTPDGPEMLPLFQEFVAMCSRSRP